MRVSNPDRSPAGINGWDPAQAPTGSAEFIGDDFPVFHVTTDWSANRPRLYLFGNSGQRRRLSTAWNRNVEE